MGLPESDIHSTDPYRVLGLERGADAAAVRAAYRRLLRVWRPEHHPREFQRLNEARDLVKEHSWEELRPFTGEAAAPGPVGSEAFSRRDDVADPGEGRARDADANVDWRAAESDGGSDTDSDAGSHNDSAAGSDGDWQADGRTDGEAYGFHGQSPTAWPSPAELGRMHRRFEELCRSAAGTFAGTGRSIGTSTDASADAVQFLSEELQPLADQEPDLILRFLADLAEEQREFLPSAVAAELVAFASGLDTRDDWAFDRILAVQHDQAKAERHRLSRVRRAAAETGYSSHILALFVDAPHLGSDALIARCARVADPSCIDDGLERKRMRRLRTLSPKMWDEWLALRERLVVLSEGTRTIAGLTTDADERRRRAGALLTSMRSRALLRWTARGVLSVVLAAAPVVILAEASAFLAVLAGSVVVLGVVVLALSDPMEAEIRHLHRCMPAQGLCTADVHASLTAEAGSDGEARWGRGPATDGRFGRRFRRRLARRVANHPSLWIASMATLAP